MRPKITVSKQSEYSGHKGSLYAMAIDSTQRYMYTSGDDGVVAVWDLMKEEDEGKGVIQLQESVYALAYVEGFHLLLVGSSIGNVYIVDLEKKAIQYTYRLNQKAIYHLAYHHQSESICVLHAGGILSMLDVNSFKTKSVVTLANNHLRVLLSIPGSPDVWIGTSDNQILKVAIPSGKVHLAWSAHDNSVFALDLHHEGKYLISGGRDAHLRVWDLQDGNKEIRAIPAHNFTINGISFSPSGDYFASASRDKTIKIWDAYTFDLLKVIDHVRNESHTHSVNRISWLGDGSIVTCGDDRKAMRWGIDIDSGK